ncbi:putative Intron-binding protein aquarius N-terminus [Blattamonas nauphoetae]|uniref:Intron-binding protein aquarius N-terminus n=1 Tax=Blattamonas nauphoetae TaxID=2049346 RepID=A0ABQ9X7Y5_9EUKA|nr:putative Intron-binding protein aquarius N-terminus [Blattamonas nauphoetae]
MDQSQETNCPTARTVVLLHVSPGFFPPSRTTKNNANWNRKEEDDEKVVDVDDLKVHNEDQELTTEDRVNEKYRTFQLNKCCWDTNLLPPSTFHHEHVLALPKLSLQSLLMHDKLLRNYTHFRSESTHTIREDLEGITDIQPQKQTNTDNLTFRELCEVLRVLDVEATGSAETHRKSLYMLLGHKQYDLDKRMVKPGDIAVNQTFNLVVRRNTKENNDYRLSSASPPIKDYCRVGKSIRCWPSGRGLRIDGVPETVKTRVTSHVITSLLKLHPNERVIVLAHHNAALKEL